MRRNLVLGSVTLVLGLGSLAFLLVRSSLRDVTGEALEARIAADALLLERLMEGESLALAAQLSDRARTPAVTSIFTASDEGGRRARAHEAANKVAEWFRDPSRRGRQGRPDAVIVTDESGRVIARDTDPNRMFGQPMADSLPLLEAVLSEGRVEAAVHADDARGFAPQQIAAAPVRDERGKIRGALLVGYGLSDGHSTALAELIGRDVAIAVGGSIVATSLPKAASKALERAAAEQPLAGLLGRSAEKGEAPSVELTLADEARLVAVRRLSSTASAAATAIVLSRPADLAPALASVSLLWPLTGAFVAVALVFGWIMANKVLVPIGVMEERVLAIINGDLEQRVEVDEADFDGLAYRIDQLVSALSGASERVPEKGESWSTLDTTLSTAQSAPARSAPPPTEPLDDSEIAAALSAEPEEAYLARVFREYATQKRAVGEDLGQISEEKFGERLRASARAMGEKHGRPVRFRVEHAGGRVILRPVLLPEGSA